jgi:hypothetical protein
MKKALAIIALAAVCFGSTASAYTPVRAPQDTLTKTKVKKKGDKVKIKKKKVKRDTTVNP